MQIIAELCQNHNGDLDTLKEMEWTDFEDKSNDKDWTQKLGKLNTSLSN